MTLNVGQLVRHLNEMTLTDLRRKSEEVFGESPHSSHKQHLLRRIAWRMQALDEGDLPERAGRIRERALEIADDADLRVRAPDPGSSAVNSVHANGSPVRTATTSLTVPTDARLPMPGALLTREYKGRTVQVRVLPRGFEYEGEEYRSLSAVAKAITGAHWNGFLFFGFESARKEKSTVTQS
jgi:hypothetical protein